MVTALQHREGGIYIYIYVHKDSCHPKPVIEAIPNMISRRLIGLSSSEEEYNDVKDDYSQALKEAGYNSNLEF